MMLRSWSTGILFVTLISGAPATSACTIQTTRDGTGAPSKENAATPTDDGSTATPAPATQSGISCREVADCAAACADEACEQACIAKGSPTAKAKVGALDTCADANGCVDGECVKEKCTQEVEACLADAPKGTTTPNGLVPEGLVGLWVNSGGGARIEYTFSADGSYHELSGLSSGGSCQITNTWSIDGTVAFADGTVTFHEVSGTRASETCGTKNPEVPISPETESKSWVLDGGHLFLWSPDCQDYKTCGIDFTKQ